MADLESKRVFLVVSSNSGNRDYISQTIEKHVLQATIYTANDGTDASNKIQNVPPQVVIIDFNVPKVNGPQLVERLLARKQNADLAVIILSALPQKEQYMDEIVTGRIQFLQNPNDEHEFSAALAKALNFSSGKSNAEFRVKFLAPQDMLLQEGDAGDFVYIVKTGRLEAFRIEGNKEVILGNIEPGEFVGEMAFINGDPRSASVRAVSDCELIEVPIGHLDKILYQRPYWSKALMVTLSKRVKRANDR